MNDPQQRGLAMDRWTAGIAPTLGPATSIKKLRQARVGKPSMVCPPVTDHGQEELQRKRHAEAAEETALRRDRVGKNLRWGEIWR